MRSKHGVLVGVLFTLVTAATLGYGSIVEKPSPGVAAGMITSGLIFAGAITAPRTFLAEDEQSTIDLLRLHVDPSAAYTGKLIYALLQNLVTSLLMAVALVGFMNTQATHPLFLAAGVVGTTLSLASGMSFAASLAMGAANRWLLSAALGIPLLLPQAVLSVIALRYGLSGVGERSGLTSLISLYGYAACMAALGPLLAPWIWGLSTRGSADVQSKRQ